MPMPRAIPSLVSRIITRVENARSDRAGFDGLWQQVADLFLPDREFTVQRSPGAYRRYRIWNDTPTQARASLAAAIHGLLTNPSIRWLAVSLDDERADMDDRWQVWKFYTATVLLKLFADAETGFATSVAESYDDLVAFGMTPMLVDERARRLRFTAKNLSSIYVTTNDDGEVVAVYRISCFSALDLVDLFDRDGGKGNMGVSDAVAKKAADDKTCGVRDIEVVHAVFDRDFFNVPRDSTRRDPVNKRWASHYIESSSKHELRRSGFDENPWVVPRWSVRPEEAYGRGPGVWALPTAQSLQRMEFDVLRSYANAANPPLNVFDGSLVGPPRTAPGGITFTKPGHKPPGAILTGSNPIIGDTAIKEREAKLERYFFLDRLHLPEHDRMTATEIIERRQQGLLTASPILSRLFRELLDPIVMRAYAYAARRGMLMPPPDSTPQRVRIEYTSPLALAQKASQSQAWRSVLADSRPLVEVDPQVLQNIDADVAIRRIFDWHNCDPSMLRRMRDVVDARRAQAQEGLAMERANVTAAAATAAKDTASALRDIQRAGAA